jgi:hypothetical protein
MAWVGGASAILGLIGALTGWFHTFSNAHTQSAEVKALMATADSQTKQGEYEAAVKTYGQILKNDPVNPVVLDAQLNATMEWVENFSVLVSEGQSATNAAGQQIDQMLPILNAGLSRLKGSRAADVEAHLGWTHWLNWHIAEREYRATAEKDLRAAVELDKNNVYANAMLGNWMLQNRGNFSEAIAHLNTAVATGKARPLVREMQVGGLLGNDIPGARAEIFKAMDDIRRSGEPLDEETKHRIVGFCCEAAMSSDAELKESLTAVPKDDAWKTYLWLSDAPVESSEQKAKTLTQEFVHARLLEFTGDSAGAFAMYRTLQTELKGTNMVIADKVDEAVKRLSKS